MPSCDRPCSDPALSGLDGRGRLSWWLLVALVGAGCGHGRVVGTGPGPVPAHGRLEGQAAEVLRAAAGDLDPSVRARALELLIRLEPEPGGGAWAPRALYDPVPFIRKTAVEGLYLRSIEPRSRDLLLATVERSDVDPYTRGMAGLRLSWAGDPRGQQALGTAWRALSDPWDAAPLALAAAVGGDGAASEALARALKEGAFPLEPSFFLDVGRSGLVALVPALEVAQGLVEEELQIPLAVALARLGARSGESWLRNALDAEEPELRMEVLDYLGEQEGRKFRVLVRHTRSRDDASVKAYRNLTLLAQGEGTATAAARAFRSEDREVRALALDALSARARFQSPSEGFQRSARSLLREGLAQEEDSVRRAAARGLATFGTREDLPALQSLLTEEDQFIRVEAAGAMVAIAGRG